MRPTTRLLLLTALCLLQLVVPIYLAAEREETSDMGRLYKFQASSVRFSKGVFGHSLRVSLKGDPMPILPDVVTAHPGQKVFVPVYDGNGFTQFTGLKFQPPEGPGARDYLELHIKSLGRRQYGRQGVYFDLPFKRMPLNFPISREDERAISKGIFKYCEGKEMYVAVWIHDGKAVLQNVYVGGKPSRAFLAELADGG